MANQKASNQERLLRSALIDVLIARLDGVDADPDFEPDGDVA